MLAIIAATRAQWDQLSDQATQRLDEFSSWLQHGPFQINSATLENFSSSIENFLTTRDAGGTAVEGLMALSQVLAGFVLMAVIVFFFLKDGRSMWRFFLHRLRGKQLAKARLTGIRAVEILGGYVRGTAIVALVDAVLIGASLLILQVPLALPLTVVIFVGAFVPVLGATVTGVLAALVALVGVGLLEGLVVAVVIVVVNQLEGQLLQPFVVGRTLHIHPLVVLMALTGGAVVGGIMGAILAVPLTTVFGFSIIKVSGFLGVALSYGTILLKHDFNNSSPSGSHSPTPTITVGPDTASSGRDGFIWLGGHRTAWRCDRRRRRTPLCRSEE